MAIEDPRLDDEIDLGELLSSIWAQKLLVIGSSGFGFVTAAFFAMFVATPTYEATVRFELNETSRGSFGDISGLGGLASLAGIDINRGGANEAEKLEDRIFSRPFLRQISEPTKLYQDPYFNGSISPPGLKQQLFTAIGLGSEEQPTQAEVEMAVAKRFEDTVSIEVQRNGVVQVKVKHPDPERAAVVANIVVDQALQNVVEMRREKDRARLDYFSEQLLDVQTKLDQSAQALKDYSLANNLRSQEELARSSAQLVLLRERRDNLSDRINALNDLKEIASSVDRFDAQLRDSFLTRHSAASTLEFRRLLGWSGAESEWTIPVDAELAGLRRDLETQYSSIQRAIRDLEEDGRRTAAAATELEVLRREIAINEIMYETMLKQFESDSLASGLSIEGGRIVDPAIPPTRPSAPRKSLIAALGLVLGTMVGLIVALIVGMRRGILYTKRAVREAYSLPNTKITHPALAQQPSRTLDRIMNTIRGKPMRSVEDLLTQMSQNEADRIVLLPSTMSHLAINGSLAISDTLRPEKGSLCLVDLSEDGELTSRLDKSIGAEPLELSDGFFVVHPLLRNGRIRNSGLETAIDDLASKHKRLVLFCPPPEQGTAVSQKALSLSSCVIVFAQSGHATRDACEQIMSLVSHKPAIPTGLLIA